VSRALHLARPAGPIYHPQMSQTTASTDGASRRRNPWNLLLLVPLLMLVTPWFNAVEPRLFGMPFFYWYQFAWVAVGVVSVAIVNATTREPSSVAEREHGR
jgi:hypothetical protein